MTASLSLGGTPREVALPSCHLKDSYKLLTETPQRPFQENIDLHPQKMLFISFSSLPQLGSEDVFLGD